MKHKFKILLWEDGSDSKRQKLDLLLKIVGCPKEDVRIERVSNIMEKHENYALTFDNMLKMIAIYFRVKASKNFDTHFKNINNLFFFMIIMPENKKVMNLFRN